jgi:hypothetical protein
MPITRVRQDKARQQFECFLQSFPPLPPKKPPVIPSVSFVQMARENGDFLQLDRHDNYYISGGDIVFLVRGQKR